MIGERGDNLIVRFSRDVRGAWRSLRRAPGFAFATIASLALGIGGSTAIFTLVDGVLLDPLPYPDSDRLVALQHDAPGINFFGLALSPGLYGIYAERSETIEDLGFWSRIQVTIVGAGDPERINAAVASSGLFRVLGATPLHGRLLDAADDQPGSDRVAVLGHALWQGRYGSDPRVIGRSARVDGRPHTIVGVLPSSFAFPSPDTAIWIDSERVIPEHEFGDFGGFQAVGRMRVGVTLNDARADLDVRIGELLERIENPETNRMFTDARIAARPVALKERLVAGVGQTLWMLMGSVGLVLLIACANVANLFLVRAEGRQREIAVRAALGAGRADLARYFLAESALLAGIAGGAGLLLGAAGVRVVAQRAPIAIPRLHEVGVDGSVLGFALAITTVTAFVFASVPLARRRSDPAADLQDGSRGATAGRRRVRVRGALVVSQVALSLLLVAGSALLGRSLWSFTSVDPGFDPAAVLRFSLALPEGGYRDLASATTFHQELLGRVRALRGVASAVAAQSLPLEGAGGGAMLYSEGGTLEEGSLPPLVGRNRATDGYLETFATPLLAGRMIRQDDGPDGGNALVVNRALANLYWPGESPVGKRVRTDRGDGTGESAWLTVVGVIGDHHARIGDTTQPMFLMPLDGGDFNEARTLSYAVRTDVPPQSLAAAIRQAIWAMDPELPVLTLQTMADVAASQAAPIVFTGTLLGIASLVSLVLGAIGVYGVLAYIVRRRTAEIGLRLAIGARSTDVRRMVLREGAGIGLLGIGVGLLVSMLLVRALTGLLFGVDPLDPMAHLAAAALLLGVVLLATWLPARRAAAIDPADALRGG